MYSISGETTTVALPRRRDVNRGGSIDTPNRKEFLVRQSSREEQSRVLGKGSFGIVLLATYKNVPVAVKLIKRLDGDKKLPNEKNILEIYHENIIHVIKITEEPQHFIVIMEHLIGNNLHYILNHTEVVLIQRIRIVNQVAQGLQYLHKNRIIHLDVKPGNIIICPSFASFLVKLCDFGNSQRLKALQKSLSLKTLSGTVAFMAPEMIKKNLVSTASDTYALAVTMWQLETRTVPYEGINNEEQIIYGVVKNNLRPTDIFGNYSRLLGKEKVLFKKTAKSLIRESNSCDSEKRDVEGFTVPSTEGLEWFKEDPGAEEPAPINWQEIFSVNQEINVATTAAMEYKYQELYKKCWDRKPPHRPQMGSIISELNNLLISLL